MTRRGCIYLTLVLGQIFEQILGSIVGLHVVPALGDSPALCRALTHEASHYTVCEIDLRRQTIKLFWRRPDGQAYGYLASLPNAFGGRSGRLLWAANAGMYHPDYRPVGLYVENGREVVPANTRPGPGNFHMKPNGVFFVAGEKAGILETSAFLKAPPRVDVATQSGPMLVIDGRLHPRFSPNGGSRKYRDGVGLRDAHTVVFAISDDEVSFGAFARLFRDTLECNNALFLDGGSAPSLYVPELERGSNIVPLGPMMGVFERKP